MKPGAGAEESPREAAFRELYEEIGLARKDVKLLGNTESWLRYDVPYAIPTLRVFKLDTLR